MNRFSSQLVFCSLHHILRRAVVEQNDNHVITQIIQLDNQVAETSDTLFFDGILSSSVISLKQHLPEDDLLKLTQDYQYINVGNFKTPIKLIPSEKPLILDFGTSEVTEINLILLKIAGSLSNFTIFEIIAACVYYPAMLLGKPTEMAVNSKSDLILWQNIDLVNKKITDLSKLINLSTFVNS